MEPASRFRQRTIVLLATLSALTLASCGGSSGSNAPPPDYAKALRGAPAPLAALYTQTSYGKTPTVLPGGLDALNAELAKLRGHPVVVNVWASWCNPCRQEFPNLQQASAKYGKQVAFLGDDAMDQIGAAKTFLGEHPLPYPSYDDPNEDAKSTYHLVGYPSTIFYDSAGKLTYTHQGPYTSAASLEADIKHYAL